MESLSTVGTYNLGFREILPYRTTDVKWKEITVNVGSSQSTLRDIKVPERSGGYCYQDETSIFTRNRFIYWRICHDILELAENSLDFNLSGDSVRYKFQNSPVLDGISIYERRSHVVILVATVSSVHRLSFPHPNKLYNAEYISKHHPTLSIKSIFHDASLAAAKDPNTFYVINDTATNSPLPHCAASLLASSDCYLFALAYNNGTILLVEMDKRGEVELKEIKEATIIPRFLKGFAGILRGKPDYEMAVSLTFDEIDEEICLFSLHRDGVLRMWSGNTCNCLAEVDIVCDKLVNGMRPTEGVQHHILKKSITPVENEYCLCLYLNFSQFSEVYLMKLLTKDDSYCFENMFVIDALKYDLIDLALTSQRIWALWRTAEGATFVSSIVLKHKNHGWQFSCLENLPSLETRVSLGMDIAEECLNYIFYPGRFPLSVITKAVTIFRRSTVTTTVAPSLSRLKQMVVIAVEAEIDKDPLNKELNDVDKLDVIYQTWLRFYSCCVQLYEAYTRPLGLLPLLNSGIVLVKKQEFSLLRPMETLEYMLLIGSELIAEQSFHLLPPERKTYDVMQDMMNLMSVLRDLEDVLPEEMKEHFMEQMHQQKSPDKIAEDMLHELTCSVYGHDFLINIGKKLAGIKNLYSTLVLLIDTLTLKQCSLRGEEYENIKDSLTELGPSLKFAYSSNLAVPALAMSLQHFTSVRYTICRSLLLLQRLLLDYHKKLLFKILDSQYADVLHSSLVPSVVLATQSYFVLLWACTTTVCIDGPASSVRENYPGAEKGLLLSRSTVNQKSVTVVGAYLQEWSNTLPARSWLDYWAIEDFHMWQNSLLAYMTLLCQQLWPVCNNFDLPNFLLSVGQFDLVQQYMRLLDSWCESYTSSRKYLHGLALLQLGQHHKALDCLIQASASMEDAVFLELAGCEDVPPERLEVQYYLNLIKKFELEKHWDSVISLATTALGKAKSDDDICSLQAIIFLQHMKLGHYLEAFHILPHIPVATCTRDCMRQAVVTLAERNQFEFLLDFPCQEMYHEFESILLSRARTMDLQDSPYYNFMYSFYMKTGHMWEAAKIMYEQGFRLGREGSGDISAVEQQAHCYLATINILSLLDEEVAWVIKPVVKDEAEPEKPRYDPKKKLSEEEVLNFESARKIEQLTVDDVRREYKLVSAKLRLVKFNPRAYKNMAPGLNVNDFVAVLASVGLYELALELCDIFSLSMKLVFEALTMSCVKMSSIDFSKAKDVDKVWEWLQENGVSNIGISDQNISKLTWGLLQTLCERYELPRSTELHKVIIERLMLMGMELPHWLVAYYRMNNPTELLRLFLMYGQFRNAALVAEKYLLAAMGVGHEKFGIGHTLNDAPLPTYVPVHLIDVLLLEMKEKNEFQETIIHLSKLKERYVAAATSHNIGLLQRTHQKV